MGWEAVYNILTVLISLITLPPGATQVRHFGGLSTPVIVKNARGLGLVVPNKTFTVHDVADICGRDLPLKIMDVELQKQVRECE